MSQLLCFFPSPVSLEERVPVQHLPEEQHFVPPLTASQGLFLTRCLVWMQTLTFHRLPISLLEWSLHFGGEHIV